MIEPQHALTITRTNVFPRDRPMMSMADDAAICNARARRSWTNLPRHAIDPAERAKERNRKAERAEREASVLAAMEANPGKRTCRQIAEASGFSMASTSQTLTSLHYADKVMFQMGTHRCRVWWMR